MEDPLQSLLHPMLSNSSKSSLEDPTDTEFNLSVKPTILTSLIQPLLNGNEKLIGDSDTMFVRKNVLRVISSHTRNCLHLLKIGFVPKRKCFDMRKMRHKLGMHLIRNTLFYFKTI